MVVVLIHCCFQLMLSLWFVNWRKVVIVITFLCLANHVLDEISKAVSCFFFLFRFLVVVVVIYCECGFGIEFLKVIMIMEGVVEVDDDED